MREGQAIVSVELKVRKIGTCKIKIFFYAVMFLARKCMKMKKKLLTRQLKRHEGRPGYYLVFNQK